MRPLPRAADLRVHAAETICSVANLGDMCFRRRACLATALMVVPVNTLANWRDEFKKWLVHIKDYGQGCIASVDENARSWATRMLGVSVLDSSGTKGYDARARLISRWYLHGHRRYCDEEGGNEAAGSVCCGSVLIVR